MTCDLSETVPLLAPVKSLRAVATPGAAVSAVYVVAVPALVDVA